MRPMLATPGRRIPTGPEWLHEVKWDGMRVLADVHGGRLRLASRNENDVTASFPELAGLAGAGSDLLLDGEVVALREGVPSFQALAERMHVQDAGRAQRLAETVPVTYVVFDLLRLSAEDLIPRPLQVRRPALERLELGPGARVPPVYEDGELLAEAARQQHLEGVVSKRRASRYSPGRRSTDWLKFPVRPSFSFVVGGWRPETDSASRLGALLVGAPTAAGLSYRGKVGAGLAGRAGQTLLGELLPRATDRSPFCDEVPRADAKGTTWLRPELVVDVEALGVTQGGRLRQPAYRGVRWDVSPGDLAPEEEH